MSNQENFTLHQVPPIIVQYPTSTDVEEKYRNEIIVATTFKLKNGTTDYKNSENHINLKQYPIHTVCSETKQYYSAMLNQIHYFLPFQYYDIGQYDHMNNEAFLKLNMQGNQWFQLPASDIVYIKYQKSTSVGCQHYIRGCQKECYTCKKFYPCRICHDEVEDHEFPRYQTQRVKCNYCQTEMNFNDQCTNCKIKFGTYLCYKCKIICGMGNDAKPNFHCNGCNQCKVGIEKFVKHCNKCNQCYRESQFDQHRCKNIDEDCLVCLNPVKNSIYGKMDLNCGHSIHIHCYSQLLQQNITKCPKCKKFFPIGSDRENIVQIYRDFYEKYIIPLNHVGNVVNVKCNDCMREFEQETTPIFYCSVCKLFNCEIIEKQTEQNTVLSKKLYIQNAINKYEQCDLRPKYPITSDVKTVLKLYFPNNVLQDIENETEVQLNDASATVYAIALNTAPKSIQQLKQKIIEELAKINSRNKILYNIIGYDE